MSKSRQLFRAANSPRPIHKPVLIEQIADRLGVTKKLSREFLSLLAELCYEETKKNGAFILPGIGKVYLKKQAKRKSRNPASGEEILVDPTVFVKFTVFESCKRLILQTEEKS